MIESDSVLSGRNGATATHLSSLVSCIYTTQPDVSSAQAAPWSSDFTVPQSARKEHAIMYTSTVPRNLRDFMHRQNMLLHGEERRELQKAPKLVYEILNLLLHHAIAVEKEREEEKSLQAPINAAEVAAAGASKQMMTAFATNHEDDVRAICGSMATNGFIQM